MTYIANTTPPVQLVEVLSRIAERESQRTRVRLMAASLGLDADDPLARALRILRFVHSVGVRPANYDARGQWIDTDATHVAGVGADCAGLAILYCALALYAGIPCRIAWVPGRWQVSGVAHVMPEVFDGGHWYSADPTDREPTLRV